MVLHNLFILLLKEEGVPSDFSGEKDAFEKVMEMSKSMGAKVILPPFGYLGLALIARESSKWRS